MARVVDKMTESELHQVAECIQDECRTFDDEIAAWLKEVSKNCADAVLDVDAELDRTTDIIAFLERRAKLCDQMDSNIPGVADYQELVTNSLSHLYGEKIKLVKMRSRMQASVKEIGSYDRLIARKLTIANIKILMQTEPKDLMDVMNSFVPEPLVSPVRPLPKKISEQLPEAPISISNDQNPLLSVSQPSSKIGNTASNSCQDSCNTNMFPMESLQSTFHQHLLTQGGNLYNSSCTNNSSQASIVGTRPQTTINSATLQLGVLSSELPPTVVPTSSPECAIVEVPVCIVTPDSTLEQRCHQTVEETPSVASGSRTTNELDSVFSSIAVSNQDQQEDEVASSVAVVEPIDSEVNQQLQQHSDNEVELITVTPGRNNKTSADFLKLHSRTNTEICRGTPVFGFKRQSRKWMKGEVVSRTPGPEGEDLYRVKYRGSMFDQTFNQAKQIAFATASARQTFKVQTRVLARFSYDAHEGVGRLDDCPNKKTQLATGVIGEMPMVGGQGQNKKSSDNKNRYLIFFDSGEVQYVPHGSVWHLFVDTEPGNVWTEFVDAEMGAFLEVYFHFYPKRFLLQDTVQGKVIKVKDYGRWSNALIAAVDCNIIKVVFDDLDGLGMKYEWIFRGSDRIETVRHHLQKMLKANPLKRTLEAESCVSVTNLSTSTKASGKASSFRSRGRGSGGQRIITISSSSDEESESVNSGNDTATAQPASVVIPAPPTRTQLEGSAVLSLRNSKTASHVTPVEGNKAHATGAKMSEIVKAGAVSESEKAASAQNTGETKKSSRFFGGKKWANDFVPQKRSNLRNHKKCTPQCLDMPSSSSKSNERKLKCILQRPIFAGFERELIHTKLPVFKTDNRKVAVVYKAPCGKRLRDLNELDTYLSATKCDIPIDTFSFDPEILNLYDSVELESDPIKDDVSNGVESMPIRVVNNVDDSEPVFLNYILERQPSREVEAMMNTDPGFLVCCDCTDNCRDKKKCRCCQLTIETTREGRNKKSKRKASHANAGYDHRRLTSRLEFGLFECNSRCACSKDMCYNRVVQQGVQVRLELFMTDRKGWGVRALDYIPGGTFICNYSGELMTKKAAEMGAMATGDTYLMNLDFMEQVDEQKNVDDNDNGDDEGFSDDEDAYEHDDEDDEDFIRRNRANIDSSTAANNRQAVPGRTEMNNRSASQDHRLSVVNLASSTEDLGLIDEEDIRPASDDDEDDDNGLMAEAMNDLDDDESSVAGGVQGILSTGDVTGGQRGRIIIKGAGSVSRRSTELSESDQSQTRKAIFNEDSPLVLDSMRAGNIGRFINHSCEPNLFVQNVFVDNHDPRFPYVGFFVGEKCIAPGTELGWDYGYEVDSVEGKVIYCHCGAPSCQKRIL